MEASESDGMAMKRVGFTLQVRPGMIDEYRRHHAAVWPEMRDALRRSGWHDYSLFLRKDGTLFGYVEVPTTFEDALAAMDAEPVNARWQALMAPFFEGAGRAPDQQMEVLEEVFHLNGGDAELGEVRES
jgi:L-rhamnose mutarotase